MGSKEQFELSYAEDFRIACTINYLRQEEVLQYFVNRVSFYAFNGGEMEAVALSATKVIIDCKEANGSEVVTETSKKVQRIAIKYIMLFSELNENDDLSTVDKMKENFYLMQDWETEVTPLVDYPKTFPLKDDRFLILTFDFNLLCRMNGVDVAEVLQYFIDQISLAKQRAANLLKVTEPDSSMFLFEMMLFSRSMQKNRFPIQHDVEKWYSEKLLSLDDQLKTEYSLEKRIMVYKAFYIEWYNTLIKNLN